MAQAYTNNGGSGYRIPLITITTDTPWYPVGNFAELINGAVSTGSYFSAADAVSGKYLRFEFPTSVIIDEVKWYQHTTDTNGSWKWQGSDDAASWTDIGSAFTLGGYTTQTQTELNGNTTAYKYYQLVGVSGNFSTTPHIQEIEFKIGLITGSYLDSTYGSGDRTAAITVSYSGINITNAISKLVDGLVPASGSPYCSWNQAASGATIKFDFGSGNAPVIDEAIWLQSAFYNNGTWKWQGSDDDSNWDDIGSAFGLGEATLQIQTELNGNTTGYRYYRLLGVSGSGSDATYMHEILFNIAEEVVADIAVSVTESLTLSESVTGLTGSLVCSVSDSVTVAEVTTIALSVLGSICWGHDTSIEELNAKNFQGNWTGTGSVGGSEDEEVLELEQGTYMESENVQLGTGCVLISINKYRSGTGVPIKKYKTSGTSGGLAGVGWSAYTDQFYCEGWAKIRLEVA